MRVDLEYLASMLDVFLAANTAYINLSDLENAGIELSGSGDSFCEMFIFHMEIAIDQQLIGCQKGAVHNLKDIGVRLGHGGGSVRTDPPIRLTQKGHDFASALNNREVLAKLKSEFKDAPFKSIFDGSQNLLQHYMKKKLDNLLKNESN